MEYNIKTQKRNCTVCNKEFQKPYSCSRREWETRRKTCSPDCRQKYWIGKPNARKKVGSKNSVPAWNKGLKMPPLSIEQKEKLSRIAKEKGFGKWMLGKPTPDALRKKRSEYNKKRVADGIHNFYIDGRTPENKRIRHSIEYRDWRVAVFKRDDYTCQECGSRGVTLHADHIKPFAYFPELRLVIENGRTLCVPCHQKTDTYKGKAINHKPLEVNI